MKVIETESYVSLLRELTEQGREVNLQVAGNSMSPFLVHGRDVICFARPTRRLKTGDMVFYQRRSGQFVMHRIWKARKEGYYIVGDAQMNIEGPIEEKQIFAIVNRVQRKGKWIGPGDFWWEFFEHIWIRMIPFRRYVMWLYGR